MTDEIAGSTPRPEPEESKDTAGAAPGNKENPRMPDPPPIAPPVIAPTKTADPLGWLGHHLRRHLYKYNEHKEFRNS